MTQIILHHYETSPVSELVRVALGFKKLSWSSVIIPMMAPKPDLEPLTGGYRKTPVMQIGAHIYCDSQCILDKLESLHPSPTFFPQPLGTLARIFALYCGGPLFAASAVTALAPIADTIPEAFWADRKALFGTDKDRVTAMAPHLSRQWMTTMAVLAAQLADGRPFLMGDAAGYADVAAYMDYWFGGRTGAEGPVATAQRYPRLAAWAARVAAFGHGTRSEMTAQEALAIAKAATPQVEITVDPDEKFMPLQKVGVRSEDPGAITVVGALQRLSSSEIVITREDAQVGTVAVHFPRLGYVLLPAG